MDLDDVPVVRIGHRKGKPLRSEVLRARVTPSTKVEVHEWMRREDRDESEMVRILLGEALQARAAKYRTR